jgi:hypothetical protein
MKIHHLRYAILLTLPLGIAACSSEGLGAGSNAEPGPVHDHAANEDAMPVTTSPGDAAGVAGSSSANGISGAIPPESGVFVQPTQRPLERPSPEPEGASG